jgi:hypothetical protein
MLSESENTGVCVDCSAPSVEGRARCQRCGDRARTSHARFRTQRVAEGHCASCLKALARPGMTQCQSCADAAASRRQTLFAAAADRLGGRCRCCGEGNLKVLTVDHRVRDWGPGGRPRQEHGPGLWRQVLAEDDPHKRFQLLCRNCNWSKRLNDEQGCRLAHAAGGSHGAQTIWRLQQGTRDQQAKMRLRIEVLAGYAAACACCDETDPDVLQIDHIAGGGVAHREQVGSSRSDTNSLLRHLRNEGFPTHRYRLLCANCNWATYVDGDCPHRNLEDVAVDVARPHRYVRTTASENETSTPYRPTSNSTTETNRRVRGPGAHRRGPGMGGTPG